MSWQDAPVVEEKTAYAGASVALSDEMDAIDQAGGQVNVRVGKDGKVIKDEAWLSAPVVEEPKTKPAPTEKPDATAKERGMAGLSGINKGIASLLGLPVDTLENVVNLAVAGYGTAKTAITGKPGPSTYRGSFGGSEYIARLMNDAGAPTENARPDDAVSRMLYTGGTVAGGSIVPGASVRGTAAAATGAALAAEINPELAAIGAMTPAAIGQATINAKSAIAKRAKPNVDAFEASGASPSVGQATQSPIIQGLENVIAKIPGGQGVMRKFSEQQQADFGGNIKTNVTAEDAGRAIERGITKEGGFLDRTKAQWSKLDSVVSKKMTAAESKPDSGVAPTNTMKALDELTADIKGAEEVSKVLTNDRLKQIYSSFKGDMAEKPGKNVGNILDKSGGVLKEMTIGGSPAKKTMPYEAMREMRTKVGALLENSLVSGVPNGEMKKLYGALTKDMEAAANKAGVGADFKRQNDYYRARMERIDTVLEKVIGKGKMPEDIFLSASPTNVDQTNKIRAVMRSLDKSERQVVSEAVINRMGRSAPGKQNELGEKFSSETFLSNWNRLSNGAKAQIFPDHDMRGALENLSKAAADIRESSSIFANYSGTTGAATATGIYSAPIVAIGAASTLPVIVAGGTLGAATGGAKLLTNKDFVRWLAKSPTMKKPESQAAHVARLATIYNASNDEAFKHEMELYVRALGEQQ